MPVQLPGRSIKAQLITLLFSLTTIAIVVLGFLGVRAVLESGQLSSNIAGDSRKDIVEQLMVRTVTDTAAKNSAVFGGVQSDTITAAQYVKDILDNPGKFSAGGWRFDQNMSRLPTGQLTNSAQELSSVFISTLVPLTAQTKREVERLSYLDNLFPAILKNEPNAVALYYNGLPGYARFYPNVELAKLVPPDFDIAEAEFFSVATPTNNPSKVVKWTSVYDDPAGQGLLISAAYPVYNAAGVFVGTTGMDVILKDIAKNIEDYRPIQSSYAFLIDNAGRAIALPEQGYRDLLGRQPKDGEFGPDLKGVKGDFEPVLKAMRAGKNGFHKLGSDTTGAGLYVAYAPIAGTNFSLGLVAKQAVVLQVVEDLKSQVASSSRQVLYYRLLPAALVILIIVWIFGFIYIRLLTAPIKELTAKTTRIARGDLNVEPAKVRVGNEIGQLASSFNDMVTDLRDSREKIKEQNQELLHNQQARLKASINSLQIGFIMTDPKNNIIMLNGAARTLIATKPAKTHGKAPAAEAAKTLAAIDARLGKKIGLTGLVHQALETGRPVERPEADFEGVILHIFVAPILEEVPDGGVENLGAVILLEDVTAVKQLERSKDEFFSIASHELRTPLTAVRGNAAMLKQMYSQQVKDQPFNEMVDDIHGASVRLIGIVNDFLDASRLEQDKITFENQVFPLPEVLNEVVTELGAITKEKGIEIKIDGDLSALPPIYADRNRTKQIVYNLVGNAMKFTEKGGITIGARVEGEMLKTRITDTGPGIPPDKQHFLFQKFRQVGGSGPLTRDASRGTGLGLYISKLLSEQMGGAIRLENSQPGVGTTFSFTLPVVRADGHSAQPKSKSKS